MIQDKLIDYRNYLNDGLRDLPLFTSRKIRFEDVTLPTFRRKYTVPKKGKEIDVKDIITNVNDWDVIYNKIPIQKEIIGMDTETIDGKVELIADSDGNWLRPKSLLEFCIWLEDNKRYQTVNMFYNLNYDIRAFLHFLTINELVDLATFNEVVADIGHILYIPNKFFQITHNKHKYKFYDIFQFYYMSLNKASKKYLGKEKLDVKMQDMNNLSYWKNDFQEILDYCIYDSVLCRDLAILSQQQYNELGLSFNSPISTASLAEQFALRYSSIPKYNLTYFQKYGYYSYFGGWFEQFSKGYHEQVYKYDINSAYPAIMKELPDISDGEWFITTKDERSCTFGFVRVKYTSIRGYIQPNPVLTSQSLKYPTLPKHRRYITLDRYRFLLDNELAILEPEEFVLFYPNTNYKPFGYMQQLYDKRLLLKIADDMRQLPLKILINATYGKTIQIIDKKGEETIHKAGQLYLPVYASYITDGTQLELLKFTYKHDITPIAYYTDAVLTTDNVQANSTKLGDWDIEKSGELISIGSGVYSMRDGDKVDSHIRGFSSKLITYCDECKSNSKTDTCNHIRPLNTHLWELVEKYSNKTHIPLKVHRPLGHKEVANHRKVHANHHVNQWINIEKDLDINFDKKRIWNSKFNKVGDILTKNIDSMPVIYR